MTFSFFSSGYIGFCTPVRELPNTSVVIFKNHIPYTMPNCKNLSQIAQFFTNYPPTSLTNLILNQYFFDI